MKDSSDRSQVKKMILDIYFILRCQQAGQSALLQRSRGRILQDYLMFEMLQDPLETFTNFFPTSPL